MVDLFAVNDFIMFLKKEYPEINVSVKYCPVHFELTIQLEYKNHDDYFIAVRKFIYTTEEAIGAISYFHIDYLATLSKRGVKLNGSHD